MAEITETISDESFNTLIATVEAYLSKEKTREDVESAVSKLEAAHLRKHLDHLQFLVVLAWTEMIMVF